MVRMAHPSPCQDCAWLSADCPGELDDDEVVLEAPQAGARV